MTITSGIYSNVSSVTNIFYKNWYRQDPVSEDPLPYRLVRGHRYNVRAQLNPGRENVLSAYGLNVCQMPAQINNFIKNGVVYPDLPMDRLYNAAYGKFASSAKGIAAELLVNLAERREAYAMMRNRLIRIVNAVRSFRQLDFAGAARALGVVAPSRAQRNRWDNPRQWGSNWLEWHFGWSPTIGDIYTCVQIMDTVFPEPLAVEASGWKLDFSKATVNGPLVGTGTETETFKGKAYCRMSSEISVSDLVLLKANQLGLINPASVVWELVPFSFLADWFGTIGLWLGSFTDFIGLDLNRKQHVYFIKGEGTRSFDSASFGKFEFDYRIAAVKRMTGSFPGPTIALRRLNGLSVSRGLTAISLILGLFAPR